MKKFNKVLAVALAVLMLAMIAVPASADYARMPLNEYVQFTIGAGETNVRTFTARTEGWYVLNTYAYDDYADPQVWVFDETGYQIAYGDDSAYCSKDCEVWFYAEAGATYYIEVGHFNDGYASFEVYLEAENEYSHIYHWDSEWDGCCDWCGYQICNHGCHKGGIAGFFWSISNFFNRLFGLNERCDCGAWHW